MTKIAILSILFLNLLYSAAKFTSTIPLPTTFVVDLSIEKCSKECIDNLRDNGQIFDILALLKDNNKDYLSEEKKLNLAYRDSFDYKNIGTKPKKIAILLPSKVIKRYSQTTVDSIMAYMVLKNIIFDIKVYDSKTEDITDLKKELYSIINDGYDKIIAILTTNGSKKIVNLIPDKVFVFIPTVNKNNLNITLNNNNIIFGGVDYQEQLRQLIDRCETDIKVINYASLAGKNLKNITDKITNKNNSSYTIRENDIRLESFVKNNGFKDSCLVLNTPIVKSSVLLSSFTYYDNQPSLIISTEINYHKLILSSTMYRDRKHMILATSKKPINSNIYESIKTLSNDLEYNWVNYSTLIAVDYFASKILDTKREFDNQIVDNQVIYELELIKPSKNKFIPIDDDL